MKREKISRGTLRLIKDSIRAYTLAHGRNPYALAFHPIHVHALRRDAGRVLKSMAGVRMLWTPLIEMLGRLDERGNSYDL